MEDEEQKHFDIMVKLEGIDNLFQEKIRGLREDTTEIKEHLRILNGQVVRNTAFRNQGRVYFVFMGVIGTAVLGLVLEQLFM